jgi:hypothetical protein
VAAPPSENGVFSVELAGYISGSSFVKQHRHRVRAR